MTKHLTILGSVMVIVAMLAMSPGMLSLGVTDAAPASQRVAASALSPSSGSEDPQQGAESSDPDSAVAPGKIINGANAGAYYLDYGGTVLDPAVYPVKGALRFYNWGELQYGASSYYWTGLDDWITNRKSLGLRTGIFITTYGGTYDGDIRATPDFVIQQAGTMLVSPFEVEYFRDQYNGNFEFAPHANNWSTAGDADITNQVPAPPPNWAGRLGGKNNASGDITTWDMRIPAMPPELASAGGKGMTLTFSIYVSTTDVIPNADHLYVEIVDRSNGNAVTQIGDITNTSGPTGSWVTVGPIDLTSLTGRTIQLRFRTTTNATTPTTFYVDNNHLTVRLIVPKYWDTNYKNAYKAFITELGNHLRLNTDLDFVAIGTGLDGENQPVNGEHWSWMRYTVGLESATWLSYLNAVTDAYVMAFTQGSVLRKDLLLQYAPYYLYADERRDSTDYAAGRGVGLSYNGLLPDWEAVYEPSRVGAYDPIVPFGAPRWNTVPIAWESYTFYLCTPVFTYWALFNGLDKHADYMRIGDDLLTGSQGIANTQFFAWAKDYWGKTTATTPSVWVVMREHRNPLPLCHSAYEPGYTYNQYPQLGNYSFWLYQYDTVPEGKTVAETNDKGADSGYAFNPLNGEAWPAAGLGACGASATYDGRYPANYPCFSTPYNPDLPPLVGSNPVNYYDPNSWTGAGKEAWVIRRTDQATGNPKMFFDIDDQYIDGTLVYSVTISVKYLDMNYDTWSLWYDSQSGPKLAGTVTKMGTKAVKTAVFNISDGRFANGLGGGRADFYIDSRSTSGANDGNEWIHMVDVAKLSAHVQPTATPTATNTPTRTPTPTITPTSTPSTGAVEGVAFYDANGNSAQDPGEPGLPGAVLALQISGVDMYTVVSGAGGAFRFDGVTPGQYRLVEKTPPAGYLPPPFPIVLWVFANTTTTDVQVPHSLAPTATPTETPTATLTATPTATATPTETPTETPTPTPWRLYLPTILRSYGSGS